MTEEVWPLTRSSCTRLLVSLAGVLVLCGVLGGCVPDKVQVRSARQFNPTAISSVAVLPFQTLQTPQWSRGPTLRGLKDSDEIRTQFRLPGTDQYGAHPEKKSDMRSPILRHLGSPPMWCLL